MQINIKATGIELTPAIRDYVEDKINSLAKFIGEKEALVNVEIGKTTKHHKLGDFFRAEVNLDFDGHSLRAERTEEDLYAAIDTVKDGIKEEVKAIAKKKKSLVKKGGRIFKDILKKLHKKK